MSRLSAASGRALVTDSPRGGLPAKARFAFAGHVRPRQPQAGGLVEAAPLRGAQTAEQRRPHRICGVAAQRMADGRNRNAVSPAVVGGRAQPGKALCAFPGRRWRPHRESARVARGRTPASAQFRFDAELLCLLQLGPVEVRAGFGKAVKVPYSVTPAKGSPCGGVFEAA
ncbi:MAG: hypothetical protein Pg6A_08650 [Termitinemataceae bacterium]|nr:MAG: hypothetical protein Pg6A_08650 [Termitinemataceae bacterium]